MCNEHNMEGVGHPFLAFLHVSCDILFNCCNAGKICSLITSLKGSPLAGISGGISESL